MRRRMMKSKIHRATVTDANLHYVGSITVDPLLLEAADILEYEQVAVVDIDNGSRFETYTILGEPGSGEICLNGAAARLVHPGDTLAAGVELCDVDAVRVLVDESPTRVNELIALGAVFDRDHEGALMLAREGGHSMPRVVHAGGAATGAEIERALVEAVRATAAAVYENWFALDLVVTEGRCHGVDALDPSGERRRVGASHVLLATGGAGQLFAVTTNPAEATGDGMAMALRAGVPVADLEFMQFHPTALHH